MRLELRELRESQREEERRISDESKLLYAEAFGSFNLGLGSAKSDSEVRSNKRIIIERLTTYFLGPQDRVFGDEPLTAREAVGGADRVA